MNTDSPKVWVDGAPVDIVLPIIHSNGTAPDRLIADLVEAADKLKDAYDKMKQCAPNGRDYYPEAGRMEKAESQHRRRLLAIQDLYEELENEIRAVDDYA
jgi:hypothetical protein